MNSKNISKSTLNRLPMYLSYLQTLSNKYIENISATAIANQLKLGEVQVRKDLAAVSRTGKPKVGYNIKTLRHELMDFLGYKKEHFAVIAGIGKLGRAILDYEGFKNYGLSIVCGFDNDPDVIGMTSQGKAVLTMQKMREVCSEKNILIGIITVPAHSAQSVCDEMINSGIKALLNFAPVNLDAPENIVIYNENLAVSLAMLSNELNNKLAQ